jgi:hypothetical protein
VPPEPRPRQPSAGLARSRTLLEPVLVGLDRQRPDQPQATPAIGKDAHHMGAALDLLIQALHVDATQ